MSMADWYLEKACEHYKNKEFEEAIKLFSKVVEGIGPDDVKVKALCFKAVSLYELGIQFKKKQSFEEAKQKLEEARKVFAQIEEKYSLEPDLKGQCYYKKGLLLCHIKDYEGAKNAFNYAINSGTNNHEILSNSYYYSAFAKKLCLKNDEQISRKAINDLNEAFSQNQQS